MVLFNVPDGHTKEMPKSGSKHKESEKEVRTKTRISFKNICSEEMNKSCDTILLDKILHTYSRISII